MTIGPHLSKDLWALAPGPLQRLCVSVARERPFGPEEWTRLTAQALGLESTLRNRGRPRKQ